MIQLAVVLMFAIPAVCQSLAYEQGVGPIVYPFSWSMFTR